MIRKAPAKINLGLEIIGKRKDGFHDIKSLFYPIDWNDVVEIVENDQPGDSFEVFGIEVDGDPKNNLVLKAVDLIKKDHPLPSLKIALLKNIPIGAGLGGGSSDASTTLMLLNEMFHLNIAKEKLMDYAAELGSDCPFFIHEQPALVEGRGELSTPVDFNLNELFILVHYPNIHVSTKDAYSGLTFSSNNSAFDAFPGSSNSIFAEPVSKWSGIVQNDFENTIFAKHPNIAKAKTKMLQQGALYAAMSGSGSSVFGLFKSRPNADSWDGKNWIGKL